MKRTSKNANSGYNILYFLTSYRINIEIRTLQKLLRIKTICFPSSSTPPSDVQHMFINFTDNLISKPELEGWWRHRITYLHGLPQRGIKLCSNLVELHTTGHMKTRVRTFYYRTWSLLRTKRTLYLYRTQEICTKLSTGTARSISFYYRGINVKKSALVYSRFCEITIFMES